jgi:GNAT superfamily N-acetyltransferase
MQATPTIATAAACAPGTPFAMVTNMAVAPAARRQGVARQLMQAAVKTALVDLDVCVPFVLLLAYKYYEPAMRCVCACGCGVGVVWVCVVCGVCVCV